MQSSCLRLYLFLLGKTSARLNLKIIFNCLHIDSGSGHPSLILAAKGKDVTSFSLSSSGENLYLC